MSRLGKSFKSKLLRQALAVVLAGTMVMSGIPVSAASESSEDEMSVEAQSQEKTESILEEAAEADEAEQKESAETEEKESEKPGEETETTSEEETTTAQSNQETETVLTEDLETSAATEENVSETETEETETEETETEETETEETEIEETEKNNRAVSYTSSDAVLADGHTYAEWSYTGGTLLFSDGLDASVIQSGKSGIYKNAEEDILYIDSQGDGVTGKFEPSDTNSRIQINANTKIYIPVKAENNQVKIAIYQSAAKTSGDVIYTESNSGGYFAISGDELVSVECTDFKASGAVSNTTYYMAELTCTLNDGTDDAIICVEVKVNNFATKITSGEKVRDDLYDDSVGDSADLVKYNMEGYANAYGVTGGGVIKTEDYYTVSTAEEFLDALVAIQKASEPAVIRITDNLNLGSKEVNSFSSYSSVITEDAYQALMHPTLKKTGVSDLNLKGFRDLTIFSTNGAAIKHCGIIITNSENIIFRNLVFDELWEWDDIVTVKDGKASTGEYDRNDWDYINIDTNSDGIWIDHCTFYKAYDGVVDVKHAKGEGEDQRVTISWCKFEPKSAPKMVDGKETYPFYDAQINYLEQNIEDTYYYRQLRTDIGSSIDYTYTEDGESKTIALEGEGYTKDDIIVYTCGQKKTHLLGQDDNDTTAKGIRVTLANNSYKNSMDRMPRLRFGKAHVYNCILDASDLYTAQYGDRDNGKKFDGHLVSNGALSNMGGYVFLENCYIDGIRNPLISGNGTSTRGYIGAENSIYKLGGDSPVLTPVNNSSTDKDQEALTLTKSEFEQQLPDNYGSYKLYDASSLNANVLPYAGAGVVEMNPIRWTKTSYGDGNTTDTSDLMDWDSSGDNDPARNDNTDYSIGDDDDPSETNPTEKEDFSLNAAELAAEEIESDYAINGFTIKAAGTGTDKKNVTVAANSKTAEDGTKFTQVIKLNGTANADYRSIYFTTQGKGTLTVYAVSASSGTERNLVVYDENFTAVTGLTKAVDSIEKLTYEIPEAGSYYIGSAKDGINIYYIAFEHKEEDGDEPPTETENEDFSLNAVELVVGEIESDYAINGFTIKAAGTGTDKKNVTVAANSKTAEDGTKFTQVIKLNGTANADYRSIYFTTKGEGTLTVYAVSASSGTERNLVVYDENFTAVTGLTKAVDGIEKLTYEIPEAGSYYIGSAKDGINIYYIAFEYKSEEGSDEPPTETDPDEPPTENENEDFSLNAAELVVGEIESDYAINGFTIKAAGTGTDKKNVTVAANSKTAEDGTKFTQVIKLNGTANADYRSIYFTTKGEGTLTVYAVSASSGTERNLVVYDENFTAVTGLTKAVDSIEKLTYEIPEAGSYYIGSAKDGINIYYIAFEYKSEEGGDNPTETEPDESEPPTETEPGESEPPTETEPGESEPPTETEPGESEPPTETEPGESEPPTETQPGESEPPTETEPGESEPPTGPSTNPTEPNKPGDKSGIQIEGLEESYDYTGAKIVPDIKVWDYDIADGKLLIAGVDYTASYKNNTKVGTATVTVTGKGNYVGKDISKNFTIIEAKNVTSPVSVKGAKINSIADIPYTGEAQYPDFVLTLKGGSPVTYTQDTNKKGAYKRADGKEMDVNVAVSNNINKGTATILVTGALENGKTTSIKKTFKITTVDLNKNSSKVNVEPLKAAEYAVGGAVPESLTVTYDGRMLMNGRDYTVKYSNNKKTGTASITITGKGNYAKKYSGKISYNISRLDLSGIGVSAVTAYDGIKAGKIKATVLDKNGTALKASQYTLEIYKDKGGSQKYSTSEKLTAGTIIYVAAKAKDTGNLLGTTPVAEFKVGRNISKAKFTVSSKEYTGESITLADEDLKVTMKGVSGSLRMGEDYEIIAYSKNINKGTATAIVSGIGDYSGTKTIKFKITQKKMKN